MDNICPKEFCTGCHACRSICPAGAVLIEADTQGFYKARIDRHKCIDCHLCKAVCPANRPLSRKPDRQDVFACHSTDELIREESSSGGVFTHLAETVLADGGVVFGAGFATPSYITHGYVLNTNDLQYFRGSKYVQSFIGETFKQAVASLNEGKQVLFSGTPCQIDGLNSFASKIFSLNHPSLITVDLVCHGVPSPRIYKEYLAFREKEYDSRINKVSFRRKPYGWHSFGLNIVFDNQSYYFANFHHDPFLIGFLKNYYLNTCCYTCKYANTQRQGDITIADFWGYRDNGELPDDDKGLTLIITNSENGGRLFEKIKNALPHTAKNITDAVPGNAALKKASFKHRDYDAFWKDYEKLTFAEIADKYLQTKNKL